MYFNSTEPFPVGYNTGNKIFDLPFCLLFKFGPVDISQDMLL